MLYPYVKSLEIDKIGKVNSEPIKEEDIDICHRVSTQKAAEKNIAVRFVRRSKRNAVLDKARKKRGTIAESLGFLASTPIYVNQHLTRQNKQLLGAAIARKKEEDTHSLIASLDRGWA